MPRATHKLIPSFIHPLTHFYVVPLTGPDRAVELTQPSLVPMVILNQATDEWWGSPPHSRVGDRIGPFSDAQQAAASVTP